MAEELNGTCAICGEKYHICNTCSDVKTFKPWRTIADTIECYRIYEIIHSYTYKSITKSEAKEQLSKRTIPHTLQSNIKKVIDEILKEESVDKKLIKGKSRVKDPEILNIDTETSIPEN